MRAYDAIADWYAATRSREIGVPETIALARALPHRALVLDIGCGNGAPITRALLEAGCRSVGIDSSGAMLARFRANCPGTPALQGLAQQCAFIGRPFDAAVS